MAYKDDFGNITGLDYWWELDGDETDSVGTLNSDGGTDPSWVTSIVPNAGSGVECGDYNGSSSVTDIPNASDINDSTTTQKTIWAWVYIDTIDQSNGGRVIWGEGGSQNGLSIYVYDEGGTTPTLHFDAYEGSTHDTISWTGVATGTLYLITAVLDCTNGNMYLYVNGSTVASKTGGLNVSTDFSAHSAGVAIGGVDSTLDDKNGSALSGYFDGRIADVGYVAEATPNTLGDHQTIYNSGSITSPIVTDVDGDEQVEVDQTNVVITGTSFGTTDTGSADVEFGDADTYGGSGTLVSQSRDSWSDTSIQIDVSQGGLSVGTVWVYVTNSGGTTGDGFPIQLGPFPPIITDMEDEQLDSSELDNVLTGTDFLDSQGTGKVEIANNAVYGSATIKVTQTIDSWSDTSIQFDFVQGTLPNGTGWIFVTTDDDQLSNGYAVNMGPIPQDTYEDEILSITNTPQHLWTLQNNYTDSGDWPYLYNANTTSNGSPGFSTSTPLLCRGDTHAFHLTAANQFISPNEDYDNPRSENDDYNAAHNIQFKAFWVRFDRYHQTPSIVMEEGANVNDMCLLIGFGNILLANGLSDTADVQSYSDKPLRPNRTYHVMLKIEGSGYDNELALYIDGVKQSRSSGNPWGQATFLLHNGDLCLGWNQQTGTYGQMNIGGTVMVIGTAIGTRYSHWCSWHDKEVTDTEISDTMFGLGVGPDYTIGSGTPSAMQTAMEAYDDTSHGDASLVFYVDAPTGGGDLELKLTNQVFHDDTTLHVQWRGGGVLTLVGSGTTNLTASKMSNPWGGTIVIIPEVNVTVHAIDIDTSADIQNARVLVTADTGGDLPFEDSVSITRSASTATVTHTSHGLLTGNKVLIAGANQNEYNGIKTITVTTDNAYTYTVSGTPATPATGTITSTSIILTGLTDVDGEITATHRYTSNQPFTGKVRKSSSSVYYQTATISGTITVDGYSETSFMIKDE